MRRRVLRPVDRERGAALPLVLGFLVLISAITLALLSQATANVRNTRVAKDHQSKVYDAASALDWAIQRLRFDSTICPAAGSTGNLTYPSTDPDIRVTLTCATDEGGAVGAGGWSVFTTRTDGPSIITQGGANDDGKLVGGPVYNSGTWDLQADLVVRDGFVRQRATGLCPGRPIDLVSIPAASGPGFYGCSAALATPAPVRSLGELTDGNFAVDPPFETMGSCRVFSPGRYTIAPELADGTNYFRPGVYLLDNVTLEVERQGGFVPYVAAGLPVTGTVPSRITTGCPSVTANRNGATFLLAGSAAITVDATRLEVFGYYPGGPDGRSTQAIYQLEGTPAGWTIGTTIVPPGHVALRTSTGASQELVAHGHVHVAQSDVQLLGTGSGHDIQLLGGVLARSLTVQASSNIGPFFISNSDVASARSIEIQATVELLDEADLPIGKPVVGVATVFISNDSARSTSVSAWRINEDLTSP